jgi:hypothetical protein
MLATHTASSPKSPQGGCFPTPDSGVRKSRRGARQEAIDVATVESPSDLTTDLVDLTGMSLTALRSLDSPQLEAALRHAVDRAKLGSFGDTVQEQR